MRSGQRLPGIRVCTQFLLSKMVGANVCAQSIQVCIVMFNAIQVVSVRLTIAMFTFRSVS